MALASSEAGIAISQTRTTAVHAVSYPLTTHYGIAHGHACALTLFSFIDYNEPVLKGRKMEMLCQTMKVPSHEEAVVFINRLMDSIGLQRSLRGFGIDQEGIEKIVENSFRADRVKNNPRELTPNDL